ncbi:hypothetical protein OV079_02395 [Nannocystis pusilla]|uniref:Uncharacterized protein n=1 Tax=Nannocystis pusilla TaxID=889268 RepID=A0A9X3IV16_9BACT|nr:hypothetical protein [Nannocystis pusilla]MCY1004435.1 hypothetical protein [Nannocystis pusilla]
MTAVDTIELETNPETASYRHGLRRRLHTVRSQYEDEVADAKRDGLADEVASSTAGRAVQGSIRALLSELLARAALPAVREFLATGHAGHESVAGLLADRALLELVESAYPEPTWTAQAYLDRHEAEDDALWLAWMTAWAEAFDASASAPRRSSRTIAPTTVGKNDPPTEKTRTDMTSSDASSKPTLSPRMQNIISLLTLAANAYVAADKCRQERLAGETVRPATLEDVMAKSGLRIPGIQDALVQLMGGSEEAKKAASLLVTRPTSQSSFVSSRGSSAGPRRPQSSPHRPRRNRPRAPRQAW